MDLTTKFDGLTLKNPLMPAAGPLVGDAEKLLWLKDQGLGALVAKTISTKDAHIPHPCIIGEGNNAIFNCELWTEYPKEKWINEFLPELVAKKGDTPLIISVGYTKEANGIRDSEGDYRKVLECLKKDYASCRM